MERDQPLAVNFTGTLSVEAILKNSAHHMRNMMFLATFSQHSEDWLFTLPRLDEHVTALCFKTSIFSVFRNFSSTQFHDGLNHNNNNDNHSADDVS